MVHWADRILKTDIQINFDLVLALHLTSLHLTLPPMRISSNLSTPIRLTNHETLMPSRPHIHGYIT
jgi:hypothetical protein